MKFSTLFTSALVIASGVSARPHKRDVNPALVPEFGHSAGINPTGTGDCDGAVSNANGIVKIPCFCPPERGAFLKALNDNVNAGHAVNNPSIAVSFPTDGSKASALARMHATLVTLQNLNGPGRGCPAAATTLVAQQKAIQAGPETVFKRAPPHPLEVRDITPRADDAAIRQLAPDLGFTKGRNPTGTGDCDGAVNGPNGAPIKIPCSCPPDREEYLNQLVANVRAGHAIRNPSVAVAYPTDDSPNSRRARITAALITLQNLKGPGVGCPAVSTTLLAQQKAI